MPSKRGGKRPGAGRPKGSIAASKELRDAAREHTQNALDVIVEIMNDKSSPHQLKAAELILIRGHGSPSTRDALASSEIIEDFQTNKISAITACLMLEAEGVQVPPTLMRYLVNELEIINFVPFNDSFNALNDEPEKLPRF